MAVNRHITVSAYPGGNFTAEKLSTITLLYIKGQNKKYAEMCIKSK